MKMNITYEEADIKRLIRNNLARQGIAATDADITFKKNQAFVSVEVSGEDEPVEAPRHVEPPVEARVDLPREAPPKEPPLQVVEGGNAPVDMSDVLRANAKIARERDAPFPGPKHVMLEGESTEFPGT